METGSLRTAPTASEPDNFFSKGASIADSAHFTGFFARETTTKRHKIQPLVRPIRGLSPQHNVARKATHENRLIRLAASNEH